MATVYLFTTRLMLLVYCLPRVWIIVPVFVEVPGIPDSKPIDIWGNLRKASARCSSKLTPMISLRSICGDAQGIHK